MPVALRASRSPERLVARRVALAFVALLVAVVAVAGAILFHEARVRRTASLDAHLSLVLASAANATSAAGQAAQQQAAALAARRTVQRALAARDARLVRTLLRGTPGAHATIGAARPAPMPLQLRRDVRVLANGRTLGTVSVSVPLGGALLARIRASAPLRSGEGVLFVSRGRIVAAPAPLDGRALPLSTRVVELAGTRYRIAQTRLVRGAADVRLAALAPLSELDGPVARAQHRLLIALAATLLTLLLLGRLVARPALAPFTALVRQARSSLTDELTELPNRRAFLDRAQSELDRARRSGAHVAVAMIDVDNFKSVNDTYGHAVGDDVLRAVAAALREGAREIDVPARYGGEEFVVLFPETPLEGAREAAERLRRLLESRSTGDGRSAPRGVTISIGVAAGTSERELPALIEAADAALYGAKRGGKNRVVAETDLPG